MIEQSETCAEPFDSAQDKLYRSSENPKPVLSEIEGSKIVMVPPNVLAKSG